MVTLRRNANLSTGGTSTDVTDLVHPEVAAMCCRAAAAAGLDVCGVDVRLADIDPLPPGRAGGRGDRAERLPRAADAPRAERGPAARRRRGDHGPALPAGRTGRIPIVSVTGTNGKTTTVRMIAHILGQAGLRVGMATHGRGLLRRAADPRADASGPRSAEMVLDDPAVEAAVLETARGGIVRRGLGYDQRRRRGDHQHHRRSPRL